MYTIKNTLISLIGLLILTGVFALITPKTSYSENSKDKDVNVVNTPNVQVTNTPTVNAQQQGAWNVGLTPGNSVAINNTPTVNLAPNSSVLIGNTTANPIPVSIPNQAIVPFRHILNVAINEPGESALSNSVPVPVGKRLIIEHVSAMGITPGGQVLTGVQLIGSEGPLTKTITFLALSKTGSNSSGSGIWIGNLGNQQMRLYLEPTENLRAQASRNSTDGVATVSVSVTGQLVDQ